MQWQLSGILYRIEANVFLSKYSLHLHSNSGRDCNVFSSEIRKCSQNVTRPINKETGPSSITIYDKNGVVVLRWNISTEPEAQAKSGSASHIIPKSQWNRPPIFWRRRKRNANRGLVTTCYCRLNKPR
ncbi:hypothetical protein RB195_021113 [Necator americanus]|uniref:Uncharacterized protein n=1 Tax=Necator americanus TaxID=51031 RepID=A0ABR1E9E9_NECAM